jgi:chromosome partitioning protein
MKVLALANQKGGVGKTFLVFHLAHFLAEKGRRVLVVDLDPQGNLSLCFRLGGAPGEGCGVCGVFEGERLSAVEVREGILLVTSDIRLARYEASAGGVGVYFKLKKALEAFCREEAVDFVLIDCPPSLGLFSLSAFVAARKVVVPMRSEVFSVSGLGDLLNVVAEVRENINPDLEVAGIVLNAVQERTRVARETLEALREGTSLPLLALVPLSVKAEEAVREGRPVWRKSPEAPISRALREGLSRLLEGV